jgi:predicted deacylase
VDDAEQRRQMAAGMLAWNTDVHFVYIDIAGSGLLVGEAERQGKIVVSTELAGGGQVTAATHRIARSGLANVLRHFGVLPGPVETRDSLGLAPSLIVRATEIENYPLAPESGLWETFVDVGDRVEPGQVLGQIHFIERPERTPAPVHAHNGGYVCSLRAIATTDQGDNLAVVGREIDAAELA